MISRPSDVVAAAVEEDGEDGEDGGVIRPRSSEEANLFSNQKILSLL
jgi:hypothetical protein